MPSMNHRAKAWKAGKCIPNVCHSRVQSSYVPSTIIVDQWNMIGTYSWTAPPYTTSVEYLVVGGGGGGGGSYDNAGSGGGGAGRVSTGIIGVISGNNYTIVVGEGGAGGIGIGTIASPLTLGTEQSGTDGSNSQFYTIISGGGYGGNSSRLTNGNPGMGGSSIQGINGAFGGNGGGGGGAGGGGGGNATAGGNRVGSAGGLGGTGVSSNITGVNVVYGAGGVGGGNANVNGSSSVENTGNGGDGTRSSSFQGKIGRNGASGIVVLKYLI